MTSRVARAGVLGARVVGRWGDAAWQRRRVALTYINASGDATARTVRPVGLFFWGYVWSLEAWCELREDFRSFRLDRIGSYDVQTETFPEEPGKTLADFFAEMDAMHGAGTDRRREHT